jgi:AcrR family transcriptional regulator
MDTRNAVREIIIDTAGSIFARFGFKKTIMDEIARAVHKAKSSIYHYFQSKEEIFQAIVTKEGAMLKREIKNAIASEDNPQKKLRAYVITRMHILRRLANLYSALKDEYLQHYGFIEKIRKEYDRTETALVKEILRDGVEKGMFMVKNLDLTANAIIVALKAFEYPWTKEENISKIEQDIDVLLGVLFYGLVKR